jgi:hypothetical protein
MSLINDALKEARKAPPRNMPSALAPMQPEEREPWPVIGWLLPAVVVLLIVGAIFFIGWAWSQHSVHTVAVVPPTPAATPPIVAVAQPAPRLAPVEDPPPPPPPVTVPVGPKLQGIFYSPTSPSAIIEGKILHTGDSFRQYRVKSISKYAVTLVGPDKKEMQVGMED